LQQLSALPPLLLARTRAQRDAGVARNLRKVTFLPPAPPSGAGDDGGGGNGGNTDFLHLFDAFDTFKQPQSAADASAPAAGGVGGAGLDGDVWADEWQGLSDIFNGDLPMADLGGGGFAAGGVGVEDSAWLAPLPELVHLEPSQHRLFAVATAAGGDGGAKAAPAKKRKARGGAGGTAAARQKQQRSKAVDAANPRRRWSKAAIARADAAKAYAVKARLDGLAWEATRAASAADAAMAAVPAAPPLLPRREQGRVALQAKKRLQLMWEMFAPAAAAYAEASAAASSAVPSAVADKIKVLQKQIAALQKARLPSLCPAREHPKHFLLYPIGAF
jgi:hypothetical protein